MLAKPSTPSAWWMLAVFFVTALVSYTDRLILSALVDDVRAGLGLSDSEIGLLQGPAFTLVYVFAVLGVGRLADRQARKPLLIAGALLWCAAAVLCGYASSGSMLLAGRFLLGAGEAVLLPTAFSMIADVFPAERRGLAIGILAMGTVIGGPLGITIGGVLLEAAKGGVLLGLPIVGELAPWRAVLVTVGMLGFVAPLLLATISEPPRQLATSNVAEGAAAYFRGDAGRLLPLYGAMALLSIGDYGLVSWVPTALTRRYAWPSDQVGVVFGFVTAAAGVMGALAGGWISDRAERATGLRGRLTISVATALLAAFAAAAVSSGRPNGVVAGLGLWVLASTVAAVGAICVLQTLVVERFRATSIALLTFSNTLVGLGAGPTLVGLTTDRVYGNATAVDWSISTVAIPAGLLACGLLSLTRWRVAKATV